MELGDSMALDNNIVSVAGTAVVAANGVPVEVKSGNVSFFSENDDGSITGSPSLASPETSIVGFDGYWV